MKKKVLIIEDNDAIRENIVEILQLAGYSVFEATNGKSGVELATLHIPDIILCDITMPELDGYGVLYLLGKNEVTGAIPFVFLTAKTERLDMRKGMEMGADDYLTKPFDDIELLNAIESRLKKISVQQAVFSRSLERLDHLISRHGGLKELKGYILERRSHQYKKNQVIYYEGDHGNNLYLVISGKIKTIKIAEDGREFMTGIYAGDSFLGVNAIVTGELYTDTASAMEDSVLCLISRDQLEPLLDVHPELGRDFIRLLAGDIRKKEEQLLQLAYHSVRKRMAEAILRLYSQQDQAHEVRIAREDLASMAGIATETVSRTLSDFKEEGIIGKKAGTITILDLSRLLKMKN